MYRISPFVSLSALMLSALWAGEASAQVTVTLESGGWSAAANGSATLPPGSPVVDGTFISVPASFDTGCFNSASVSASESLGATYSCGIQASTEAGGGFCGGPLADGTLLARLAAPTPTLVRLEYEFTTVDPLGALLPPTASVEVSGQSLAASSGIGTESGTLLVSVGASGTTLALVVSAGLAGTLSAQASIEFAVAGEGDAPMGITVTSSGTSCGPLLAGSLAGPRETPLSYENVQLSVFASPDWPAPFLVFGTTPLAAPLPSSPSCLLQTDILFAVPLTLTPFGSATVTIPLAAPAGPLALRLQYLIGRIGAGGLGEWRSSDVVELEIL